MDSRIKETKKRKLPNHLEDSSALCKKKMQKRKDNSSVDKFTLNTFLTCTCHKHIITDLKSDGLPSQSFHENLHGSAWKFSKG